MRRRSASAAPLTPAPSRGFEWSYTDEPHRSRRAAIAGADSAGVRSLLGPEASLAVWGVLGVALQVGMAFAVADMPWLPLLAVAYLIGGTINHAMTLAMHETSHNLAFSSPAANRLLGLIINLPLGVPSFVSFQRYHREHHQFQGADGVDVDLPTELEGAVFTNAPLKVLWMLLQPFFYAFRPAFVKPKAPGMWEVANLLTQLCFDGVILYLTGVKGVSYLLLSTCLGMGIHPMAGHFLAEHYTFAAAPGATRGVHAEAAAAVAVASAAAAGQSSAGGNGDGGASVETYSYYGPLNWFSFNVGYHNEHHDFPQMRGTRLPDLKALAPTYYEDLPAHYSWVLVIARYIMDPSIGPFSRVKRAASSNAVAAQ